MWIELLLLVLVLYSICTVLVEYGVRSSQNTGCVRSEYSLSSPEEVLYLSVSNPGFAPHTR